jgi:cobaltochelatase CobN
VRNESLGHLASPLPTSPARGEVLHRVFGRIVPDTPAGTLPLGATSCRPLAGRVGEGGAKRAAF